LEECLSSLRRQDFKDFEVVLVDNASKDASVAFVKENFPEVRVVQSDSNLGFTGGNNLGITFCSGEYVLFLNNDTRVESDALGNLARAIQEFPDFQVFACALLRYSDPTLLDSGGDTLYTSGFFMTFSGCPAAPFFKPREILSACAGAAVYPKELLHRLGGFDDDFFLLFEDVDLSMRARHLGAKILFVPNARVLHKGSATIGDAVSTGKLYYCTRNLVPLLLKNFPAKTLVRFTPGMLLNLSLRFLHAVRAGRGTVLLKGCLDGLRMVPGSLRKRRAILASSKFSATDLNRLLRTGWFREWRSLKRGNFNLNP
jgi:GT2 family glycosyltransferase